MFLFQQHQIQQVVFYLMFPVRDVIYLDMSFEEASKFIVSAGTSTKKSKAISLIISALSYKFK